MPFNRDLKRRYRLSGMGMHAAWAAERKAALRGTRRHGGATAQHKTVTHWQPTSTFCAAKRALLRHERIPFSVQKVSSCKTVARQISRPLWHKTMPKDLERKEKRNIFALENINTA